MTNQEFGTHTYTTRPKTSKRTTFQDELKAAVSARSRKTEMGQYSYSDDLSEAEDDFLLFLKSRQKKASALEARNNRTNVIDDELFDEGSQRGRMKKVSFLETYTIHSHLEDAKASDSHEYDPVNLSGYQQKKLNNSFSIQTSSDNEDDDRTFIDATGASTDPQMATLDTRQSSGDHEEETIIPLLLDNSETEPPGPKEKISSALEESCQTPQLSAPDLRELSLADSVAEKEPPKPKPRQRTFGKRVQTIEKMEDAESEDFSRPQTSSTSIPLYTDTSSGSAWAEEEPVNSGNSPSNNSKQSQFGDNFLSDNNSNPDGKNAEAFEENLHSVGQLDQPSNTDAKIFDTRTLSFHSKTPQKSQRLFYKKVESKYLGTCKLLDQKVSLEGSQPQTVNTLRAAVYQFIEVKKQHRHLTANYSSQKWLQEKKEATKETMLLKKKEELTEDKKKKQEEEEQKEAAAAAYEAWKKHKAQSLEVKAREKKEKMRKEQKEIQEKEEKRQAAKQVYDKWKLEHDQKLKTKLRTQKEVERKCQLEKKENEQDRKRDSKYAFSSWSEKKKNVIHERLTTEHKIVSTKEEEEQYIKEERDKMAIEAFENWLTRKGLEEKRQREEMRIQTILCESPPPPWNPPNKTVPFHK